MRSQALTVLFLSLLIGVQVAAAEEQGAKQLTVVCGPWPTACNGDGSGLHFDIIRAVYQLDDFTINYLIEPYMRGIKLVNENKVDMMASTSKVEAHRGHLYPNVRLATEHVALLRVSATPYVVGEKISGSVGALVGYDYRNYYAEDYHLLEVEKTEQGVKMLLANRIDYFIGPRFEIEVALAGLAVELGITRGLFAMDIIASFPLYLIFPNTPKGARLADIYDKNMKILVLNGEIEKIISRYSMAEGNYTYPEILPH